MKPLAILAAVLVAFFVVGPITTLVAYRAWPWIVGRYRIWRRFRAVRLA